MGSYRKRRGGTCIAQENPVVDIGLGIATINDALNSGAVSHEAAPPVKGAIPVTRGLAGQPDW